MREAIRRPRGRRARSPFFLGRSGLLFPSPKPSQNPPIILPSGFDIPPGRPHFSPSQPFLPYFFVFFGTPKLAKKSSPPKTTFWEHFADFRHVQRQFLQHFCQFWIPPGIILAGLFWVQFWHRISSIFGCKKSKNQKWKSCSQYVNSSVSWGSPGWEKMSSSGN